MVELLLFKRNEINNAITTTATLESILNSSNLISEIFAVLLYSILHRIMAMDSH